MTDTFVPRIPLGQWADAAVSWLIVSLSAFFDLIKTILISMYDALDWVLASPPFWAVALVLSFFAFAAKGWKLALGSLVGFTIIVGVNQWHHAMDTLALVVVSTAIALVGGIPLGIWAARNRAVSNVLRPILDFMQTMPAFVYLIPTVLIFLSGPVPGIVATIVFALAPGARFTELGIRQVDKEVVEAGKAFGASDGRILRQIQLPLALPTIMAGINQVIMLSLSMVVMAGLVGAGGLGGQVVAGLQRIDVGLGFEAGLSVVILAVYLDRVTSALSSRSPVAKALATTNV